MRMGQSTFALVTAVRGAACLATLVGEVVCAVVGNLAVVVLAVGRMALAHNALYARSVVQIGIELAAFDVARGLLDVAARLGTLLFKMLVALVRQPICRARCRLAWLGLAEHLVDALSASARTRRPRRRGARRLIVALMRAA
jgi:hypothetical protein